MMYGMKPCPFCGQTVSRIEIEIHSDKRTRIRVECECGADITISPPRMELLDGKVIIRKDALEMWNERAGDE